MAWILTIAALILWVPGACCQSIGIYADSSGTDSSLQIPYPGPPVTIFVVANPEGIQHDGITTASFRIAGLPDGWSAQATPSPVVTVAIGDVFDDGVQMAWSYCIIEPVVLMRVSVTSATSFQDATIELETHRSEDGNCFFLTCGPCVKFCGCDGIPRCYCPETVPACINGDGCALTIDARTWTVMKALFK